MACLVSHWNAQPTSPGSCSSLIRAWFHLHSEAKMSWHWWDRRPSDCCFMSFLSAYPWISSALVLSQESCQVGSKLFPYEVHDLGMVLIKPVSVSSGRWSKTLHVLFTVSWRVIHGDCTFCSFKRMVSSHSSKALTNDCLVGTSFSFMMFSRFGTFLSCGLILDWTLMLSLEMIRRWPVQHSVPLIALVILTSHLSLHLTMTQSIKCQCLELRCIQDVLLWVERQNTVLVIRRLCLAQVWRSSRLLLLYFPVQCLPSTPSQEALSRPTLALKSLRMMILSAVGTAGITYSKSS